MVSPLELLVTAASADGGWGYRPDQPAHVEPTCFTVLALAAKLDHAARLHDELVAFSPDDG